MTAATEPNGWTIFSDEHIRGRSCGSCTLCCTEVAVAVYDQQKPAGVRCWFLRSTGCSVYEKRPQPCRYWSCRWLFDPDTAAMRRPDLSGYIIDPQLDTIMIAGEPIEAVQVWISPKRPDAHQDPALRDYLQLIAERWQLPAILRWRDGDGMLLMAPCISPSGDWLEHRSNQVSRADLVSKIAAAEAAGAAKPVMHATWKDSDEH